MDTNYTDVTTRVEPAHRARVFAAEADAEHTRAEDLGESHANTWEARNARVSAGHASDLAQAWALIAVAAELHEMNRIMRGRSPRRGVPAAIIAKPAAAFTEGAPDA